MTRDPKAKPRFDDARMELLMGGLLRSGVLLASAVVLLGGVLYLRAHGKIVVSYNRFSSEPESLRQMHDLARGIGHGDPASIIQVGILILIATPVARVILAAVAFAIEHDRLYLAISLTVLAVLLVGLFRVA